MIRRAAKHDVDQVLPLIYTAAGSVLHILTGTNGEAETLGILKGFFVLEGNRLSYENILVAERNGQVVGVLVCYPGSQCEALDRPFLEWQRARYGQVRTKIVKEARDDEYYLDTLAVADACRRQGIGTALMATCERKALEEGYDRVSLLAEESNERAFPLYRKLGYIADSILHLGGHDFHHMVKLLK